MVETLVLFEEHQPQPEGPVTLTCHGTAHKIITFRRVLLQPLRTSDPSPLGPAATYTVLGASKRVVVGD